MTELRESMTHPHTIFRPDGGSVSIPERMWPRPPAEADRQARGRHSMYSCFLCFGRFVSPDDYVGTVLAVGAGQSTMRFPDGSSNLYMNPV